MRLSCLLLSASLALLLAPVQAQEAPVKLSPRFARCVQAAAGATPATADCQSEEWERQDKRLNAAYRQLLSQLPAGKATELRAVQRAWLAYVGPKCAFMFDSDTYSGQQDRLNVQYCEVLERARRAAELEDLDPSKR